MEINKNTPKTHLKMMEEYCEKRSRFTTFTDLKEKTEQHIEELKQAQENYEKNGTIKPETVKGLFALANVACYEITKRANERIEKSSSYKLMENHLRSKGYNPQEVFDAYHDNFCIFENALAEKEEEKQCARN